MKIAFPKKKGKSRKYLIKKLDGLISKFVIKRDKRCVVCASTKQLGCGHVFSRSHYSTRWDLSNCFCQCWACNYRHKVGDPMVYYNWFQKKFGRKKFEALYNRWKEESHYKTNDLLELIKIYESK
jgi:hypothetical protein